jgi:hypothetical protein
VLTCLPLLPPASRPGYQSEVSLFMAPVSYQLADLLTWPDTDALDAQQAAYVRVRC